MRLKRLTAILLCLCMALTLLPTAALAAGQTTEVMVGGVKLYGSADTPVYAKTNSSGAVTKITDEGFDPDQDVWNIKWDGTTLTLNNAVIQSSGYGITPFGKNLEIVLIGENTVTGSYAIYDNGGALTISGSGRLTATGDRGIYATSLTVESGTVTAEGQFAIQAPNGVTVNGGTLTAEGTTYGLYNSSALTICGGTVTITKEGSGTCMFPSNTPVNIQPQQGQTITVINGSASSAPTSYTAEETVTAAGRYFHSFVSAGGDTVPVERVTLDQTELRLPVGATVKLTATVEPDNATDRTVSWGSGDIRTATVDQDGNVTGVDGGTTTITAAAGGKSATCQVYVSDDYNLHVGGEALWGTASAPAYALTGEDGAVTTEGADGNNYNIKWDGETLTLDGATITSGSYEDAAIYWDGDLKLQLTGTNTVTGPSGGSTGASYGIYTGGSLAISGGGNLTATGGAATDISPGIYADGGITVQSGSITAEGGAAENASFGIYVTRETLAISGGTVHATGGEVSGEYAYSCGIYVEEDAAISGGTVNATGGSATGSYAGSCGIDASDLTISGGTVTATGGTATATGGTVSGNNTYSCGINATMGVTISGGEVTAEGDTQAVRTTGTVIIDPAEGQQIAVTAGADADNAVKITDSPFTSEKEISDSSISSAQYFHSIAGKAGDPGPDDPNIYVGGVRLTGDKDTTAYALTNESGKVTTEGADGNNYNIMWDGETLTLKGATITQGSYEGAAIYCGEDAGINLVLVGDSTVTGPGGDTSNGIYTRGELTISGDGTLDVSGGGISLFVTGDLTISDGTVTATGGEVSANDAYSYGIFTPHDITISGGSVTAEGGTASTTGEGYAESFGISVRDLTVSGGSVNATGGTASATGPNGKAYSGGIDAYYNITISGGTVNADGGTASATGPNGEASGGGIQAAIIAISSSTVTAEGGTASADSEASSRGFYASGITISGGEVTATGGTASADSEAYSNGIDALMITVAPAEREQITVTVGADESSAAEITGSPFQEETEITGLASAAGVAYFKSAAEPARYSVTLHPNGGTIADGKDVTSYLCGTGASLPGAGDVTRSGYRFAGWYADEALTDGPYTQISAADAGDMAFYARWVRRSSGGGGGSSSRPTGPSTGHSDGWTDIREEIGSAEDGDTVTIDMNGETEVPAEIFEEIAGKDITVELDMGGGVTWTVDGRDVPEDVSLSDLDLGVDMDTSGISVDVINTVTGEYGAVQVSLDHDGAFGFALTLTAPLGRENAGYWANLYHYDEGEEALTFETSARIAADGSAALRMTHASQYAIVIDEKSHALPFEDVGTDAWYSDAVAYVYRNGLMSGTSGSAFSPDAAITRAQLVTILWRMAGSPQVNYLMDFDDVSQDAYYAEAVRWAASEGIAGGYGNGRFGSDDPITREQMAAILYRFAQHMGYDVSIGEDTNILSYTDAPDVSGYAVAALQWACGAGIIRGTGDGSTLTPQGGATRAQAAVILTRFCAQSQ
ncbi:S-layer homology domain-containing protein [Oscillibacter valericigenes]|uniref:S-layer homology domain-containing protein n=1 Tax=Oscillibacter valericigenes TaxID=351091 RepID=A0ABS2FVA9_9FIRM|nr:S-layer homology domain-containing protein [Oscillibacter valericigenes]MBM6851559.1 S-layer homology domain-containing protein [Oscillibacter valericigenes]